MFIDHGPEYSVSSSGAKIGVYYLESYLRYYKHQIPTALRSWKLAIVKRTSESEHQQIAEKCMDYDKERSKNDPRKGHEITRTKDK